MTHFRSICMGVELEANIKVVDIRPHKNNIYNIKRIVEKCAFNSSVFTDGLQGDVK